MIWLAYLAGLGTLPLLGLVAFTVSCIVFERRDRRKRA